MAESDQQQKTEEPTSKRVDEAREQGQLAISREMSTWALFAAVFVVVAWIGPTMAERMAMSLRVFLERPEEISLDGNGLQVALGGVGASVALACLLAFGLLGLATVLGTMVQTGFYMNPARVEFKLEKIMPIHGFKQLFSLNSLVELFKNLVKLLVVGMVAVLTFIPLIDELPRYTGQNLVTITVFLHRQAVHLLILLMLVVTVIAVSDWLYQRHRYMQTLRMTKQEVKDEHRQSEGDPVIKGRLRQIRMEKARKRMMAQVPKADVIITNPTHFAVALQYDNAKMAAPVVLAKGADRIAERIREVAAENAIPLVSNPPLARALYDTVDVDEAIKTEHYRAVAEVISYVYKLKGKKKG